MIGNDAEECLMKQYDIAAYVWPSYTGKEQIGRAHV